MIKLTIDTKKQYEHFGFSEVFDIASNIFERADGMDFSDDVGQVILQAIDDELIYYSNQWEVLKHYCSPSDADFNYTLEQFYCDILDCVESFEIVEDEE